MKTSWARLDQLEQDLRRRHQELSKNNYFALSVKAQERDDALRKEMTPIADAMEFQRRFDKTPERKAHLQAVSQLGRTQEAIQRLVREILEELTFVHSGNKKAQIALQLLKEPQDGAAFLRILARLRASRSAKARNRRQGAKREHVSRPEALIDQKSSAAQRIAEQADRLSRLMQDHPGTTFADQATDESNIPSPSGTPSNEPVAAVNNSDKRNLALLHNPDGQFKRAVNLNVAARFGGVSRRAIEAAANKGKLKTEGERQQRRVLVPSLLSYFPPEK